MTITFIKKILMLIASLVVGIVIGNGLLAAFLAVRGVDLTEVTDMADMLQKVDEPLLALLVIGLNHLCMFVGSAYLYHWWARKRKNVIRSFDLHRSVDWTLLFSLLLLLIGSYPLVGAAGLVTECITLPEWMRSMDDEYADTMMQLLSADSILKLSLNIIVVALLPAIGEELIFRGIVQKELHTVIKNPHIVILITSIIFSAIHLQAEGFLPKLLISYVLCYAYYWTRNLWYPVVLHFFNNAGMTLALHYGDTKAMEAAQSEGIDFPWAGVVFSLFLCGMIVAHIMSREDVPYREPDVTAYE